MPNNNFLKIKTDAENGLKRDKVDVGVHLGEHYRSLNGKMMWQWQRETIRRLADRTWPATVGR